MGGSQCINLIFRTLPFNQLSLCVLLQVPYLFSQFHFEAFHFLFFQQTVHLQALEYVYFDPAHNEDNNFDLIQSKKLIIAEMLFLSSSLAQPLNLLQSIEVGWINCWVVLSMY